MKCYKISGKPHKLVKGICRESDVYADGRPIMWNSIGEHSNSLKSCVYRALMPSEVEKAMQTEINWKPK